MNNSDLKNKLYKVLEEINSLDIMYCNYEDLLTLYKDTTGLNIYIEKSETQSISGGFKAAFFNAKGSKSIKHTEKMTMKDLLMEILKSEKFIDCLNFEKMAISTKVGHYKKDIKKGFDEKETIYDLRTRELTLTNHNNEHIANLDPKYGNLELKNFLVNYKNTRFECSNLNFNCDSVLVIYLKRPLSTLEDMMFFCQNNEINVFDNQNINNERDIFYLIEPLFLAKCY